MLHVFSKQHRLDRVLTKRGSYAVFEQLLWVAHLVGATLLLICLAAQAAPRNPIFSVPSGTTFSSPHQVAIAIPFDGEIRYTRDGSSPTISSLLYQGPLLVCWSETIKAIAVVGVSSSSVVTASYTLDSQKFPAPSAGGTTAPVITLQRPVIGQ